MEGRMSKCFGDVEDQVVGGAVLQNVWKTGGLQQVESVIWISQ
jgi:hypothetical protein